MADALTLTDEMAFQMLRAYDPVLAEWYDRTANHQDALTQASREAWMRIGMRGIRASFAVWAEAVKEVTHG